MTQQDNSAQDITLHDLMREIQRNRQEILAHRKETDQRFTTLENKMNAGFQQATQQFEDARRHREALQEDLEATMSDAHKLKQYAGMLREE